MTALDGQPHRRPIATTRREHECSTGWERSEGERHEPRYWRCRSVSAPLPATVDTRFVSRQSPCGASYEADFLVNRSQELSLAWDLVDSATQYVRPDTRAWLCAHIGAGELDTAIRTVLPRLAAHKAELPEGVVVGLQEWLRGYEGSASEDALRVLVAQLRVSAPTTECQCVNRPSLSRMTVVRALTRPTRRT